MLKFSTQHLRNVFSDEEKYKVFRKLCYDLNHGNEIFEYGDDGVERAISKDEANKAVRKVLMEICELDETDLKSKKKRKRALKSHLNEVFEVIEEDVDFKVSTAFKDSEWFNEFVEQRNVALGDDEEFWTQDDITLAVAKISGDHHDLTMQNLGEGESFKVHTSTYGMKVGKDIDLILLGRVNFTELTDKIAEAFASMIQTTCYEEVYNASSKLPNNSQFVKSGPLSSETKEKFDTLLEDVATANEAEIVIMGTKMALKKMNALTDIDWRSNSQKEAVASLGHLGTYEVTDLIEIPQRFARNDVTKKLIDNKMLLIFAKNQEKFVKFVDKGETEITEDGQNKGDLADDFQTYEVQREMGVSTILPRYFGVWKITE